MSRSSVILVGVAAVIAIALRVQPNSLLNFTALGALALLCGAVVRPLWLAVLIPLCCRAITDVVLELQTGYGFYGSWAFDYSAYLIICLVASRISFRGWKAPLGGLTSAMIFFLISNFGVWAMAGAGEGAYTRDLSGLITCFTLGLPFIKGTLIGDLVFSSVFFAALHAVESHAASDATDLAGVERSGA